MKHWPWVWRAAALFICLPLTPARGADGLKLTKLVDMRPRFDQHNLARRCQGARGTCSVFTIAGAIEYAAAQKEKKGQRFSVEFLNWAGNKATGEQVDGGFFSDLLKGFDTYGICLETSMPYEAKFDPAKEPSPAILLEAKERRALKLQQHWIKPWNVNTGLSNPEFEGIKAALRQGHPVCSGLRWPKKEVWDKGVLQMCGPADVRDGHSVLLVGYKDDPDQQDGGGFIFRNTAGAGVDGFMPYQYARAYMNDAVWIE